MGPQFSNSAVIFWCSNISLCFSSFFDALKIVWKTVLVVLVTIVVVVVVVAAAEGVVVVIVVVVVLVV